AAQTRAMKKVAGTLRLDLSQYRELEAFAQFGADLDQATRRRLIRGERIVEILKQPQYSPMDVEDQVLVIYIATRGYLDDIPVDNIARFEREFLAYVQANYPELPEDIRKEADLSAGNEEKLIQIIKEFKEIFIVEREKREGEPAGGEEGEE
ncbi:MAG: F0F1 ATP synthase subunit alpha, partial [Halanaerobiaceae bacterium]|nr:F0F1 ATP synthase subunit alpha [Halanaerobiaceae bacterium]